MHFEHPDYPKSLRPACMTIRRNRGPVFGIKTTADTASVTCESCKRTKVYKAALASQAKPNATRVAAIEARLAKTDSPTARACFKADLAALKRNW